MRLVETTKGLRKVLRCSLLILPFLFLTACSKENVAEKKTHDSAAQEKAKALQEWRAKREASRLNAEAEAEKPKPTNAIDSEKALKSINSLSDRLKAIVGESYQNSKDIQAKAESGDAAAQAQLASMLMEQGDYANAMKWNLKAAEQGNAKAAHSLGVAYVTGQGTSTDYAEAVKWFKQAAEQGDVDSQYSLGVRYAKGDHVQQNFGEAVKWFSMAAQQGQPDAQVSLSRRYANGEGVQKDVVEAYKWATVAGTYWSAQGMRDQLEKTMTPEQIIEGKNRADAFKPVKGSTPQ